MNHHTRKRFTEKRNLKTAESIQLNNEKLSRLDKNVDNSSEKNRNFFIAYLGLLIYVQAVVITTTDLNLLVASNGLKLPIIDLTVPLLEFYYGIPLFIIALHFNLLQNLESHHNKLMQWQASFKDKKVPRSYIQPFLFDFAVLENEGKFAGLVRFFNSFLCYFYAPFTLALILIRLSDRQDLIMTFFHYITFVVDVCLVWILRLGMHANENPSTPRNTPLIIQFIRDIPRKGTRGVLGFFVFFEFLLTFLIAYPNAKFFNDYVQPLVQPLVQVSSDVSYWGPPKGSFGNHATFISHIQSLLKFDLINTYLPIEKLVPRISIRPNEIIWEDGVNNIDKLTTGFQPSTLYLRFAMLPSQDLRKARLSKAQLQGINLSNTNLQGADLSDSQLNGAFLSNAKLEKAMLENSNLQGANLNFSELQGARLGKSNLQNAYLWYCKLDGAFLSMTNLQGAYMSFAELEGAYLSWTNLQEANLEYATLTGSQTFSAILVGANLSHAKLEGTNLIRANLTGANLSFALMQGADLEEANLAGADLSSAQLTASNFKGAVVQGAIFDNTNIVSIKNPSNATVFSPNSFYKEMSPIVFDKTLLNSKEWTHLESLAKKIPTENDRDNYLENLSQAKENPSFNAEIAWLYNLPAIANHILISRH